MKFIKGLLSESDGTPSSRRAILFILTLLFVGIVIYNIITGKNLDDTLKSQLFYLIVWLLGAVVVDKVAVAIKSGTTPPPGGDRPKDPPINP